MYTEDEKQHQTVKSSACLVAIFLGFLSVGFSFTGFAENSVDGGIDLFDRINPNDATPASMVRLPGLGTVRAASIVEYRRSFIIENPGRKAFYSADDLQKIKGIGPKTVEKVKDYLKFD